jgi:adenylosuccinate lyase
MIPRYKVKEIHDIWSTDNKLKFWLAVELAHVCSLKETKLITLKEYESIIKNAAIDKKRWREIEQDIKHDLAAFVQMIEESIEDKAGRWIHFGLTSSDILDTALVLQSQATIKVIKSYLLTLIVRIEELIRNKKSKSKMLSRTHGRAAEIQTYSDVFNRWLTQVRRAYDDLSITGVNLKFGKLSGPSGNYTTTTKRRENIALSLLDLKPMVCSQIIPRDVFLDYFYSIMKIMLSVEKISYDIRMHSIDPVLEISEGFSDNQVGSSAMPHKKNPIGSENLCGLARLYKSYFQTAIDNCLTLYERDMSHSCSERIIFKDAGHIACYSLNRLSSILENLSINNKNAEKNIALYKDNVTSQERMNELITKGESRKNAHKIILTKTNT